MGDKAEIIWPSTNPAAQRFSGNSGRMDVPLGKYCTWLHHIDLVFGLKSLEVSGLSHASVSCAGGAK